MKAPFGTLFLICCALAGRAQVADTASYWVKYTRKRERQLGLPSVTQSPPAFYVRLATTEGEVLDIWRQREQWAGQLTLWVKDADSKLWQYERIYKQHYALSDQQARAAGQLLTASHLLMLPSQERIRGWQQEGKDGEELIVQQRDSSGYQLKTYWFPLSQHDVKEATLVQQTWQELFRLANLPVMQSVFEQSIPFPCYTADGSMATCRTVSRQLYRQHKNEVSRYLRQQRKQEL